MDDSVNEELEDLRFSDDEEEYDDNVKVILNNKATDGKNDSFSETPAPSECNLNHENEHNKANMQTNTDFLNQSFENQKLFCEPIKESETEYGDADVSVELQNENWVCASAKELEREAFKPVKESIGEAIKDTSDVEKEQVFTVAPLTSLHPVLEVAKEVPDAEEAFKKTPEAEFELNLEQQSAPKPGKQLRPDAPVFMPTFLNAIPQWSSCDNNLSEILLASSSHLEPSTEATEEVPETVTFLVEVEQEPVSETCPETQRLHLETVELSSTPKGKISTGAILLGDKAPSIDLDRRSSEPLLSKDYLLSTSNEIVGVAQKPAVASKGTSACVANGFDQKIKQLVASNYMYQGQMEALKHDQKRLLLLLSNAKVSKTKKHTFDMLVEEINKIQFEVRTLKMEKEQLERKLRTSTKLSSNLDTKCQVTELLSNSQRQTVPCQTLPNFETEKRSLTAEFAQQEQQVTELKSFLGKLYMHNALPAAERLQVAEGVTKVESKLAEYMRQLQEHISKLPALQSENEMRNFNSPHPNLGAEISNLRNEIFDKMLYSLNGAKQVQESRHHTNGLAGVNSLSGDLSNSKKISNPSADGQSQNGSIECSDSGSESESEAEETTRVAFRVPTKKPQMMNPGNMENPKPLENDESSRANEKPSLNNPLQRLPSSSGNAEREASKIQNLNKNLKTDTKRNSFVTSGSFPQLANEKSPDQQNDMSRSNSISSGSQNAHEKESAPENNATKNNSDSNLANSAKRKVDSIIEQLQKLYPDKSKPELADLIQLSGQYLSQQGYNMNQITMSNVVEGAKHVGKQLGYEPGHI